MAVVNLLGRSALLSVVLLVWLGPLGTFRTIFRFGVATRESFVLQMCHRQTFPRLTNPDLFFFGFPFRGSTERKILFFRVSLVFLPSKLAIPPARYRTGPKCPQSVPENGGCPRDCPTGCFRAPGSGVSKKCLESVPGVSRTPF